MKKFIFPLFLALILLFPISVSATDVGSLVLPGGRYSFAETIDFSAVSDYSSGLEIPVVLTVSGYQYVSMIVRPATLVLTMVSGGSHLNLTVYSAGEWKSDEYRDVVLDSMYVAADTATGRAGFDFLSDNLTFVESESSILSHDLFEIFDLVSDWLVSAFGRFVGIFWNSTDGLTFLGVLAVIALAIGIAFLIMGVIQRFLRFRA